mmetsp:Transcript_36958/g.118526  ORF Transcript_36958/g.118526 Transcript_36958/m.118526 type:complete len:404 (-) Transcript_36958:379-1590(-)
MSLAVSKRDPTTHDPSSTSTWLKKNILCSVDVPAAAPLSRRCSRERAGSRPEYSVSICSTVRTRTGIHPSSVARVAGERLWIIPAAPLRCASCSIFVIESREASDCTSATGTFHSANSSSVPDHAHTTTGRGVTSDDQSASSGAGAGRAYADRLAPPMSQSVKRAGAWMAPKRAPRERKSTMKEVSVASPVASSRISCARSTTRLQTAAMDQEERPDCVRSGTSAPPPAWRLGGCSPSADRRHWFTSRGTLMTSCRSAPNIGLSSAYTSSAVTAGATAPLSEWLVTRRAAWRCGLGAASQSYRSRAYTSASRRARMRKTEVSSSMQAAGAQKRGEPGGRWASEKDWMPEIGAPLSHGTTGESGGFPGGAGGAAPPNAGGGKGFCGGGGGGANGMSSPAYGSIE